MTVVPFYGAVVGLFIAGFMIGAVMPARDLAVRAVAPSGSIGKAFGYVSSGFGVGGVIGPLFYGTVMDLHEPQLVFYVSAAFMLVTIIVALAASVAARRAVAANIRAEAAQPAE
jgi:MFS family permease